MRTIANEKGLQKFYCYLEVTKYCFILQNIKEYSHLIIRVNDPKNF